MPRLSLPLNHKYALKALFLKAKKVFSSKGGNPCARGAGCWVSPFPPPPFSFPRDGGSRAESSWVGLGWPHSNIALSASFPLPSSPPRKNGMLLEEEEERKGNLITCSFSPIPPSPLPTLSRLFSNPVGWKGGERVGGCQVLLLR